MNFLEKDLEEIIYTSDRELLEEKGLNITGKLFRQLRIGNYGIADLVSIEREAPRFYTHNEDNPIFKKGDIEILSGGSLIITVYELKKDKIGISAFLQAIGYVKGIDRFFEKRDVDYDIEFKIVLIGKDIDDRSTFSYMSDILPYTNTNAEQFLKCLSYSYDINGIQFNNESGYYQTEEGF